MYVTSGLGSVKGAASLGGAPQLTCLRRFHLQQNTNGSLIRKGRKRRRPLGRSQQCLACQSNGSELHPVPAVDTQQSRDHTYDVVTLGNLCVDIFIHLEKMPAVEELKTPEYLRRLQQQGTDQSLWEVGASCNFLIAAARLGMSCAAVANLGEDVYGEYLLNILEAEGVRHFQPLAPTAFNEQLRETLLCFVLIDSLSAHAFCSRYDFGPWPLLPGVDRLPTDVHRVLQASRAMFVAGCCFDELPPAVIMEAVHSHRSTGGAVFFDPGPRSLTFRDPERKKALHALLDSTDVVLMTEEEAEAVTEISDAEEAAWSILDRPGAVTQWCIIKLGGEGALLCAKSPRRQYRQSGLQVDVEDTVGCGDSFAAAVLMGFTRGHSIPATLALANAVGGATAMGKGAGRNVATLETVQGLLQREAGCASGQPAACTHSEDQQMPSGQPLAHQALSILQQSVDRHSWRTSSSGGHSSIRELTQRVQKL